jgi:hypothetical protein
MHGGGDGRDEAYLADAAEGRADLLDGKPGAIPAAKWPVERLDACAERVQYLGSALSFAYATVLTPDRETIALLDGPWVNRRLELRPGRSCTRPSRQLAWLMRFGPEVARGKLD